MTDWYVDAVRRQIPQPTIRSVSFHFDADSGSRSKSGSLLTHQSQPVAAVTQRPIASSVLIGTDLQTGQPVAIGDTERRSGLYVLGESGMGKSSFLAHIAAQDIQNGHGVFFLDPHGKAIEDYLLTRYTFNREVILLDPVDDTHSFGINLLSCKDTSIGERQTAYNRTESVFLKLWDKSFGESVWFFQIFRSLIPVLIEAGLTLVESEIFLRDRDFRQFVLQQIRHQPRRLLEYWSDFERRKDKDMVVQPFLNRLYNFLGSHYVHDIVAQKVTTLDFRDIISNRKILLVKLGVGASESDRRFIGTLILSELMHAITHRPEGETHQFSIFVDEMQYFVNSEDFATLIDQGRKWGAATIIAHQHRYGQLEDNQKLAGATLACANMVLFQTTVKDSQELAPVIADKPAPAEVRLERQYVVSEHPMKDLAEGSHPNEFIRKFSRQYFRPLQYRLEDISDAMEERRLLRMDFFDEAMMFRIEDAMEGLNYRPGVNPTTRQGLLRGAFNAVQAAHEQTAELLELHRSKVRTKLTLRGFNEFLTDIMEGTIKAEAGNEEFAQFLVERVRAYSSLSAYHSALTQFFVLITYGDPSVKRAVPFELAKNQGLFQRQVTDLIEETDKKIRDAQEECHRKHEEQIKSSVRTHREHMVKYRTTERRWLLKDQETAVERIKRERKTDRKSDMWKPERVYMRHLWMQVFPRYETTLLLSRIIIYMRSEIVSAGGSFLT